MKKSSLIVLAAIVAGAASAEIRLPQIFSDNMVLQAGMPNKIWGTADSNAQVAVKTEAGTVKTKADADGKWTVHTAKMKKSFEPKTLEFFENGKLRKTLKNVLVGEVWVLGGQSNMQWALRATDSFGEVEKNINKNVRFFVQPRHMAKKPQADSPKGSSWLVLDQKNIKSNLSAIGYYFGDMLSKKLDTPVGLIDTPLGGTMMCCWIDEGKMTSKANREYLEKFKKLDADFDYQKAKADYDKKLADFDAKHKGKKLTDKEAAARKQIVRFKPNAVSPWRPQETPCYMYNGTIAPIAGYTARGFAWYQGESDAPFPRRVSFADTFKTLITAWRGYWGKPDMPFYFFQLPSFETRSVWADVRQAQADVAKSLKNVGMICIVDTGTQHDIHPRDKRPVAKRLFESVMRHTYADRSFKPDFPEMKSVKFEGKRAVVDFKTFGAHLKARGGKAPVEVLVNDKWQNAEAKIVSRNQIEVNADGEIAGVRYAWKSWAKPEVWLFNENGLPAVPFQAQKTQK